MRALLVVNQFATTTNARTRDSVVNVLRSTVELDVVTTDHPGHAAQLAAQAAAAGVETVIALGGDGTVNEVATGLLNHGSAGGGTSLAALPGGGTSLAALPGGGTSLAALPGGNANVFARNLGYAAQPVAAAAQLAKKLAVGQSRTVGVGHVVAQGVERIFLANAGVGLDAAVIARMAHRRAHGRGRSASDLQYALLAIREYASTDRGAVPLLVDGHPAAMALVVNVSPWTYLGARPLDPSPRAGLDDGLAVCAPQRLSAGHMARILARIAREGDVAQLGAYTAQDRGSITVAADRPMWLQVDGEAVGQVRNAQFRHLPQALHIVV